MSDAKTQRTSSKQARRATNVTLPELLRREAKQLKVRIS